MSDCRIALQNVSKRFAAVNAVQNLDLEINAEEFVVLLGPSGCGKTTTLRMIAGLDWPTAGQILIDGQDKTLAKPGERDIAFVFQNFALYPHLTVAENIAFPLRAQGLSAMERDLRVGDTLRKFGLASYAKWKPKQLSSGEQQRVSLARAVVRNPKAFLMDEPLGTLDAELREQTREQLRALHNEIKATTVFVTHDQQEAMSLADRIAIMQNGRLLQYDTPRNVYANPAHLFVAHFIGSPGMNFIDARRQGDILHLQDMPMQIHIADGLASKKSVDQGREGLFRLGIRPEHILVSSSEGMACVVEHTERLGAYNLMEVKVAKGFLKARVPAYQYYADGETVYLSFNPFGCRWFDIQSEKALPWKSLEIVCPAIK